MGTPTFERKKTAIFSRLWIHINLNTATREEIMLIPGMGPRMLREFNEYRMLMFGLLMVFMMIWRPQGLLPMSRPHMELRK